MNITPIFDVSPRKDRIQLEVSKGAEDLLGNMLQQQWSSWQTSRRKIEEGWLQDLRAFTSQNDPIIDTLPTRHKHIHIGKLKTKALQAYGRVSRVLFQTKDPHWSLAMKPLPRGRDGHSPADLLYMDESSVTAKEMTATITDQLCKLQYEDHIKACIMEASVVGTGVVKGVILQLKAEDSWQRDETGRWQPVVTDTPAPYISSPSIFDVYSDPFATRDEDVSGVFEHHILNRAQFSDLGNDSRFDSDKIRDILIRRTNGNYAPLYHEQQRMVMAGNNAAIATHGVGMFSLLEYWGSVQGSLLQNAGIPDIDEAGIYWCNVWVCDGETLFAQLSPNGTQRMPYNFFRYSKVLYAFHGESPCRMGKSGADGLNGCVRSLLDGLAFASIPMAEINIRMLKDGQSPDELKPGQTFLRDAGVSEDPAVRFFQPAPPSASLRETAQLFDEYIDELTGLPAYTAGDMSNDMNQTAQGLSMQLGMAAIPIETVVKNLEDDVIKNIITGMFNWNMEWNDREEIKGDMLVEVLATSSLVAKEVRQIQLNQFLAQTNNPTDNQFIDRKYLLREVAGAMNIDATKAVPDTIPEESQPKPETPAAPPVDPMAGIAQALEQAKVDKVIAETANINIKTQFAGVATGLQVLNQPKVLETTDELLASAGYKDHNGSPVADIPPVIASEPTTGEPSGVDVPPIRANTSPESPPVPPSIPKMDSPDKGIEGG